MIKTLFYLIVLFSFSFILVSCNTDSYNKEQSIIDSLTKKDTAVITDAVAIDSMLDKKDSLSAVIGTDTLKTLALKQGEAIDTRDINPEDVIKFAESLVGTPYVYGSTDPKVGFDCSGFITYVFNNFKVKVPRSSVQFTNVGKTVSVENAKRGDIVLFTDPDFDNVQSSEIGHMGLITSNENGLITFIHSTSGKAMSVTVTPLSEHYKKRFVRIARIFPQIDS
jgi:cell wall-associated NlpC family hydrolase